MQELQLYEYAVIRVVPRVEREEFFNVGIVVFCKKKAFIGCCIFLHEEKLKCFDEKINMDVVNENLKAFEGIALGNKNSLSAIAKLDAPSRFRWLTATRSTIIQCSKVHPGVTNNLNETLDRLMQNMVK